jgi:hypothetical protein
MTYKVTKLTRQYNGHGHFKWLIQPTAWNNQITQPQLVTWREWCWTTWGPARELLWSISETSDTVWAWDTEYDHKRIYLKTDVELTMFQLKWQK